jgi:hypothetical protein
MTILYNQTQSTKTHNKTIKIGINQEDIEENTQTDNNKHKQVGHPKVLQETTTIIIITYKHTNTYQHF